MGIALWILYVCLTALGSAVATLFFWQKRFVRLADEHSALVESRRALEAERNWFEEGRHFVRKRPQQAFLCLGEVRVERRRSFRNDGEARSLLVRERLVFRNIVLSNWLEQEVTLEPSDDVDGLIEAVSIFGSGILGSRTEPAKPFVDEMQPPAFLSEAALEPERVAQT